MPCSTCRRERTRPGPAVAVSRRRPVEVEFVEFDDPALLAAVDATAARGTGWINLEPVVDEEDRPFRPGPFAFLAGPSHDVPNATWVPGRHLPDGETKPTTIGLQHAAGPRVAATLRERGVPLPDDWRITQDHPRRGLVVSVPPTADPRTVVSWLLQAAGAICVVPTTGRWRASVHAGTDG